MNDMADQDQQHEMRDRLRNGVVPALTSASGKILDSPRATYQENLAPILHVKEHLSPPSRPPQDLIS